MTEQLKVPTLDGTSTLTEVAAELPGTKVPEAGETWHQVWLVEAVQFKFLAPAAAVLVIVRVFGAGAAWPETALNAGMIAGFTPMVAEGWAPTETATDLVSVPPGPLQERV